MLIIVSVLLPLLLLDQIYLLLPIVVILFFLISNSKQTIIVVSFVALIALTSGLGQSQRLVIQIIAIAGMLFIFLKKYGLNTQIYPKIPVQIVFLVSFILFAMIFSLIFSNYLLLGVEQLIRSVLFFIILYLFYSLLNNYQDVKYFLFALFAGALIYFITLSFEIIKADFDIINLNQNFLLQEGASFIHRNAIGGFFSICISIITAFLVVPYFNRKYKNYLYIFIFFLISGLALTNSRAAIFSLIISTSYIFFLENRKALKYFFLIIILTLPFLLINSVSDTINLYFRLERIATGRDYILETVYNIISAHPLIGFGPAATKFEMYNYLPYMFGTNQEYFLSRFIEQIEFGHAHNFYLFLYTDLGIIGLIASLLIPFTFLKLGNHLMKALRRNNDVLYPLVLGIQASGIALFTRGLFEWAGIFSYGTITYDLPFWWIFSLLIFIYQKIIIEKQNIFPKFSDN